MVQISNSFIIAATFVPALAAPVLEARQPFNVAAFKKVAKIGGKVVDGASLASNVATIVQREIVTDDLEAREPRITSAQAKALAKGASEVAHHAANGIELGAAVAPLLPHKQRREFIDDLEERGGFHISSSHLMKGAGAAAAAAGFAGTVAIMNTQQHRRDFDDIDTRAYDDAQLDTRDPKFNFGKVFGKVAGVASAFIRDDETGEVYVREHDAELEARDPKFNFGKIIGKVAGVASNFIRDDETGEIYVREYVDAELDAREPKLHFRKFLGKAAGVASNAASVAGNVASVASVFARDDETGDLYVRDYDDAELEARDPRFNFGKIIGKVAGVASNFIRDDETGMAGNEGKY